MLEEKNWNLLQSFKDGEISLTEVLRVIPKSQDHDILEKISSEIGLFESENKLAESTVLFPGSFNPFHEGHKECIRLCPHEVLLVLDRNPEKELNAQRTLKTYLSVFEKVQDLHCQVYPGFFLQEKVNPTSSWLGKVCIKRKNLLLGDDSFMTLANWINASDLIKSLNTIFVVSRLYGEKEYLEQSQKLRTMNTDLDIQLLGEHSFQNLSSTKLRKEN